MSSYQNIRLEKGMYGVAGQNFTQVLESLDPTEQYRGTELERLDAYQRQLKRFDIKVGGRYSDQVSKFFATTESSALFPEYVRRSVRKGLEEQNVVDQLVAVVTQIDSRDYRSITSNPSQEDKELMQVAEGAVIPATTVRTQDNLVRLHKRGRMLVAPYEVVQYQRLDLFAVTLNQIGAAIATAHMRDAVDVLIHGDGNGNPAGTVAAGTPGTLEYGDLLRLWALFDPYEMNTLVASPDAVLQMAELAPFQNPLTGLNFAGTGQMSTPLGASLIKSRHLPEGTIIALDKNCALEKVQCGDVSIEYDKLIDRQMERAAVTVTAGFAKIFADAVKVLTV